MFVIVSTLKPTSNAMFDCASIALQSSYGLLPVSFKPWDLDLSRWGGWQNAVRLDVDTVKGSTGIGP